MTNTWTISQLYESWDKKSLYASIIIAVNILVLFFMTSSVYSWYVQAAQERTDAKTNVENLRQELNTLNSKKEQAKNDSVIKKAISQYAWDYREDLILNQIYSKFDWVDIKSINMDKWAKLTNGLNLANISIYVSAKNVTYLSKFLDYLTWNSSKIRFQIINMSYPMNTESLDSQVDANINLWMYYFDKQ